MKTALVTGGSGFTGRYLIRHLRARGWRIHAIGRSGEAMPADEGLSWRELDLLDGKALAEIIADVRPQAIVHLAAVAFVAHTDIDRMYRTNILGTRSLLQALVDANATPEVVLLASSANVYGNAAEGVLTEQTPVAPANDYAVSKVAAEHVAALYREKLPITVVRPFNYTGVGQPSQFLVPKIVEHVRREAPVIELGNLNVARDFSDVRWVVQVYERLIASRDAVGQTVNVCSGVPWTLDAVVEAARCISGHDFEVKVNPAFVRQNEVKLLVGDPTRLRSVVGDLEPIPFEETLRWMIEAP